MQDAIQSCASEVVVDLGLVGCCRQSCGEKADVPAYRFHYHEDWYNSSGSPTFSISGMVHFKSKAFASTILKIYRTVSIL